VNLYNFLDHCISCLLAMYDAFDVSADHRP